MRFDVDKHVLARANVLCPFIFDRAVLATVGVRVLGEMVEAVLGPAEPSGDEVATVMGLSGILCGRP